jgi:hypothetical protein
MHTFVKNTGAIHNLALATAFGGPIFALAGLRRAIVKDIDDERLRGRVLADAWRSYSQVSVPTHVIFTATWAVERGVLQTLHLDRRTQRLIALKDVLIAGAFVTGLANIIAGRMLRRDFPEGVPVSDKPSTDPIVQKYERYYRVMGPAHLFLVGASLAIGPAIGYGLVRSTRRNILGRLLRK